MHRSVKQGKALGETVRFKGQEKKKKNMQSNRLGADRHPHSGCSPDQEAS